jgi:phosphatidylinositol-3-phosphatase
MPTALLSDPMTSKHVPDFLAAGAVVIITFDERAGTRYFVMTAVVGPGVPAGVHDATRYNHYGSLGGIENAFGLPLLRNAANATPLPV